MKIIDLLVKMSNDENYKPTFEFKKNIYKYNEKTKYYEPSFMGLWKIYMILNDEVEIIEEDKKIEKEFIKYLEGEIYNIEAKGTSINYNCVYDSEEDYVRAMQEQSKLNTLKEILQKYKEIIGGKR